MEVKEPILLYSMTSTISASIYKEIEVSFTIMEVLIREVVTSVYHSVAL